MEFLKPKWRKVFREIGYNKLRNSLVILSMTIGIFAIGFVVNLQYILGEDMTASYLTSNPATVIFYLNDRFDERFVSQVRRMSEVEDAEGRGWVTYRFQVSESVWRDITLFAVSDYDQIRISDIKAQSGTWPPSSREMLIERTSFEYLNVPIGDTVNIRTAAGVERSIPVVGKAYDVNQRSAEIRGRAYGYITLDTLEWLGEPYGLNQLYVIVSDDSNFDTIRSSVEEIRREIEKMGLDIRFVELFPNPGKHPDHNEIQSIVYILGFIGIFSLLSSALLVINTISFLITKQIKQIGIMKSIGSSTKQIVVLYLSMILLFSVVSLLVAIPSAAFAARATSQYLAGVLNFDLTIFSFPPQVFLLEIAIGFVVPVIATLVPILKGARVSVREAIAEGGTGQENRATELLNKTLSQIQVISRPIMISIRNTFRRPGRLILTLITLILGGTMFISIAILYESANLTLENQLDAYSQFHIRIDLQESIRSSRLEQIIADVPEIEKAEAWIGEQARRLRDDESESNIFTLIGVPPQSIVLDPVLIEGRWLRPGEKNGIVINAFLLDLEPDLNIGETLTINLQGRETEWELVGVTNGPIGSGIAYTNFDALALAARKVNRAQTVFLQVDDSMATSHSTLASEIQTLFTDRGVEVGRLETISRSREQMESEFLPIVTFLILMSVLLAVIGSIGLVGTMSINVLERTREIGVLRAVGASDRTIKRIVSIEGLLVGFVSWLIGAFIAIPIGYLLSNEIGQSMAQAPFVYRYSWVGVGIWLAIAVLLANLASWLPAKRAMKISIREALGYE